MSEVFEGVLSQATPERLRTALQALGPTVGVGAETLGIEELGDGVSAAYRLGPRADAQFGPEVDKLAAELSDLFGRILVVRYDSRIGDRSAGLYERGRLLRSFGEADEVFVPLDENGEPLTEGQRFRADELDPEQEYETIENAIQQGLKAFGRGQWASLFDLMTR